LFFLYFLILLLLLLLLLADWQVQKKRRIAGRTLCRNIKNECPKPNCDEPVLLPGRCCKVCLEDGAIGKFSFFFQFEVLIFFFFVFLIFRK
jgi:hypothetical protein